MSESKTKQSVFIVLTILISIVIAAFIFEVALRVFSHPQKQIYFWDKRVMMFSAGDVFQNQEWGGFLYKPKSRILSTTYYEIDSHLIKGYQYVVQTNNYGLVQRKDIDPTKPSLLLLGDSFTEGQGASPWFYELEAEAFKYQLINGGILGTGLQQWARLTEYLKRNANIQKVLVIFISDDWERDLWGMPPKTLDCLRDPSVCDGSEDFYGSFNDPRDDEMLIRKILAYRQRTTVQSFLRSLELNKAILSPLKHRITAMFRVEENQYAAQQIVRAFGVRNVIFLHLPQKDELYFAPRKVGESARRFIHENGYQFIDGFTYCGMEKLDFLPHDGHPNAHGYSKIRSCVSNIIRSLE